MNHTQLQHRLTFATEVCYSCTQQFLISVRTCSEQHSIEHTLSFTVEVTTASGNWKHPVSLKIIFSACFQWFLCFRNGWHLTLPTLRNKVWSHVPNIYIIYKYISDFHLLPLIVSRSLRSPITKYTCNHPRLLIHTKLFIYIYPELLSQAIYSTQVIYYPKLFIKCLHVVLDVSLFSLRASFQLVSQKVHGSCSPPE